MKSRWLTISAIAIGLAAPSGLMITGAHAAEQQDSGYYQGGQWDQPPAEYREWQRRGFHDGVEGARRDYENHRRPEVDNRDEYRHPDDVPREFRHEYREGFRRGYNMAVDHMMGGRDHRDRDDDHDHHDHD